MLISINVSERCIRYGLPGAPGACPVAIGIAHYVTMDTMIHVDSDTLSLKRPDVKEWHAKPPESVSRFVKRYDGNKHVEPFQFDLDIPGEYLQ